MICAWGDSVISFCQPDQAHTKHLFVVDFFITRGSHQFDVVAKQHTEWNQDSGSRS